jgi:tRNA A-37 threonylcarbamoyl transferase component Bud32
MTDPLDLTTSQTQLSGKMHGSAIDHGRFAPGTVLADRYRIIAMLGRGGMGEVYRADDLTLGQSVALKFLPEAVSRDQKSLDRLLSEVRTARQVTHPNVCRVHDVGEVPSTGAGPARRFISMEYIDGEDLSVLLRRIGRLPPDKAVEIARQLCAGLAASHERGVLHRDLKPANIMLDGRGHVRITDFGLATALLADGKAVGEFAGTPAYMAPEQLEGRPVSAQTDIYALGLVLYEIFTGRRFHNVKNLDELRQRHAATSSSDLSVDEPLLDPAVSRVIERCLETDPRRRPGSCALVAASLPGGDPLAAAIAAGETPSPQLVAAAPVQGAVTPRTAVIFGLLFVATLATLARWQWNPAKVFGITRSTEVMAAQTRDLLADLGYTDAPVDSAAGFRYRYPDWRDPAVVNTAQPWSRLAGLRPAAVFFWYREQQSLMSGFESGRVGLEALALPLRTVTGTSPYEPGFEQGSIYVERGPNGSLDTLFVRPPANAPSGEGAPVDWLRLFGEARLDPNDFGETTPDPALALPGSRRIAWTRKPAEGVDPLRIEAAELAGRPVAFRVLSTRTTYELGATPFYLSIRTTNANIVLYVTIGLLCVAYVGGAYFLRRNTVLGRGDRRGASRLARVVTGVTFVSALLTASPPLDARLFSVLHGAAAVALFAGAWCWVFYLAIEPFVRRQWPRIMVGWSRLMAGEWRDPQVGREVFIGVLTTFVALTLGVLAVRLSGQEPTLTEQYHFRAISNSGLLVASLLQLIPYSMFVSLMWMVMLLLFRRILRSDYAAIAFLTLVSLGIAPTTQWAVVAAVIIGGALGLFVTLRVGFLSQVTQLIAWLAATALPFAPGTPGFVGTLSWIPIVAVSALALFGLYTSLAGQSIFAAADGER